jgi:hypothetical protein
MLALAVIRTRVALILTLTVGGLAGSCGDAARIGGRSVADCVARLGSAGTAPRLAALQTLAAFGPDAASAVPEVTACLADPALGEAAVATLASMRTDEALSALEQALLDAPLSPTATAAAAAACAGPRLCALAARLASHQPERAARLLGDAALWAKCDDDGSTRRAVVTVLARAPDASGRLLSAITAHAISHPSDFEDPVEVLVDGLSRPPLQTGVLSALSASGDPRAFDAILAGCGAPWPPNASEWFDAAARFHEPDGTARAERTLASLAAALEAAELPIQLAAIEAVRTLAARVPALQQDVVAHLALACRDTRPAVERAARDAWLGLPSETLAVAESITEDTDLDRARRALHAIGESPLPDDVVVPALARVAESAARALAPSVARAAAARPGGRDLQIRILLALPDPDVDAEVLRGIQAWARDPRVTTEALASAAAATPDTRRAVPLLQALAVRMGDGNSSDRTPWTAPLEAAVSDSVVEPQQRARLLRWLCEHAPERASLPIMRGAARLHARVCLVGASPRIDLGSTAQDVPVLVLRNGRASTILAGLGDRSVLLVDADDGTSRTAASGDETLSGTVRLALVVPWSADDMGTSVRPSELAVLRILMP